MVKNDIPTFKTPKGIAKFPWLNKPNMKYASGPIGNYEVELVLEGADAESFKAQCDAWWEESKKTHNTSTGGLPYSPDKDADGNETGATKFTLRMPQLSKTNKKLKPKFFKANGDPDTSDPQVGSGSTIKVIGSVLFTQYQGGAYLKLYPYNVQVINLVEYQAEGGFEDESEFSNNSPDSFENAPTQPSQGTGVHSATEY